MAYSVLYPFEIYSLSGDKKKRGLHTGMWDPRYTVRKIPAFERDYFNRLSGSRLFFSMSRKYL